MLAREKPQSKEDEVLSVVRKEIQYELSNFCFKESVVLSKTSRAVIGLGGETVFMVFTSPALVFIVDDDIIALDIGTDDVRADEVRADEVDVVVDRSKTIPTWSAELTFAVEL